MVMWVGVGAMLAVVVVVKWGECGELMGTFYLNTHSFQIDSPFSFSGIFFSLSFSALQWRGSEKRADRHRRIHIDADQLVSTRGRPHTSPDSHKYYVFLQIVFF